MRGGSWAGLLCLAAAARAATVDHLTLSSCTGGTSTALLGCSPGPGGAQLTIGGSGFAADAASNTVVFSGGGGDAPACHIISAESGTHTLVCTLYVFSAETSGTWSVGVTAAGTPATGALPTLELFPASPQITDASCATVTAAPAPPPSATGVPAWAAEISVLVSPASTDALVASAASIGSISPDLVTVAKLGSGDPAEASIYYASALDSEILAARFASALSRDAALAATAGVTKVVSVSGPTAEPPTMFPGGSCKSGVTVTLTGAFFPSSPDRLAVSLSIASGLAAGASPATCAAAGSSNATATCTLTAPAGSSGNYEVVATSSSTYTSPAFRFLPVEPTVPTISTLIPGPGIACSAPLFDSCVSGGLITIAGADFHSSAGLNAVQLVPAGSTGHTIPAPTCDIVSVPSTSLIECRLGNVAAKGSYRVRVVVASQQTSPAPMPTMTVTPAQPSVSSVTASACSVSASTLSCPNGAEITVAGSNFAPAPHHSFNDVVFAGGSGPSPTCTPSAATASVLRCTLDAPPGTTGEWLLSVELDGGTVGPAAMPLVVAAPTPAMIALTGSACSETASGLSCRSVAAGGSTQALLTVTGRNFASTPALNELVFSGAAGTAPRCVTTEASAERLVCSLTAEEGSAASSWQVHVRVGAVSSAPLSGAVEVLPPLPGGLTVVVAPGCTSGCGTPAGGSVAAASAFSLVVATQGSDGYSGTETAQVAVSLLAPGGASSPPNGAALLNSDGTAAASQLPAVRVATGRFEVRSLRIDTPGSYAISVTLPLGPSVGGSVAGQGSLSVTAAGKPEISTISGGSCTFGSPTVGTSCRDGETLTVTGSNFGSATAVDLTPTDTGSCELLVSSKFPSEIHCVLRAASEGRADVVLRLSNSFGASDTSVSLEIFRLPSSPPSISAVSPTVVLSGELLTLTGSNFAALPSDNAVTISGSSGSVTCVAESAAADGTVVRCRAQCPGVTAAEVWSVRAATPAGESAVVNGAVRCTPPLPPPVVSSVAPGTGCTTGQGQSLLCDATGASVTISGERLEVAAVVASFVASPNGTIGPAPGPCELSAASGGLVCTFTAAAQTHGCWLLRVESVVPGGGTAQSSECVRSVVDPAAHAAAFPPPVWQYADGCDRRAGGVARGCPHGGDIGMLAQGFDWRPDRVVLSVTLDSSLSTANGATGSAPATPTISTVAVEPHVPSGGTYGGSGQPYQRVVLRAETAAAATSGWVWRVTAMSAAVSTSIEIVRVATPGVTAVSGCAADADGLDCSDGSLLVFSGSHLDGVSTVSASGGAGVAPKCAITSATATELRCTITCDQTASGSWQLSLVAPGAESAQSPLAVACYRPSTTPPTVAVISGCQDELGLLPVPTCTPGDILTLHGLGFDTRAERNTLALQPVAGDPEGWSGLAPVCAVQPNVSFTSLRCALAALPRGTSGTRWQFIIRGFELSTEVALYQAPTSAPAVQSLSPTAPNAGALLTLSGLRFDAVPRANAITMLPRGGAGAMTCTVVAATDTTVVCRLGLLASGDGGEWDLSVATQAGVSAAVLVPVTPAPPIVEAVSGSACSAEPEVDSSPLYCADGDRITLTGSGFGTGVATVSWRNGTGTPPTCVDVVVQDQSHLTCVLRIATVYSVGTWHPAVGDGGPGPAGVVPYAAPSSTPRVDDISGCNKWSTDGDYRCPNGTVIEFRGVQLDARRWMVTIGISGPAPPPVCDVLYSSSTVAACVLVLPDTGGADLWWPVDLTTSTGTTTSNLRIGALPPQPPPPPLPPPPPFPSPPPPPPTPSAPPPPVVVQVPEWAAVVSVTLGASDVAQFEQQREAFREALADALAITTAEVVIASVAPGSVVVTLFFATQLGNTALADQAVAALQPSAPLGLLFSVTSVFATPPGGVATPRPPSTSVTIISDAIPLAAWISLGTVIVLAAALGLGYFVWRRHRVLQRVQSTAALQRRRSSAVLKKQSMRRESMARRASAAMPGLLSSPPADPTEPPQRDYVIRGYDAGVGIGASFDGAVVRQVDPGTPADVAGVIPGMQVVAVAGGSVSESELSTALAGALELGSSLVLSVVWPPGNDRGTPPWLRGKAFDLPGAEHVEEQDTPRSRASGPGSPNRRVSMHVGGQVLTSPRRGSRRTSIGADLHADAMLGAEKKPSPPKSAKRGSLAVLASKALEALPRRTSAPIALEEARKDAQKRRRQSNPLAGLRTQQAIPSLPRAQSLRQMPSEATAELSPEAQAGPREPLDSPEPPEPPESTDHDTASAQRPQAPRRASTTAASRQEVAASGPLAEMRANLRRGSGSPAPGRRGSVGAPPP